MLCLSWLVGCGTAQKTDAVPQKVTVLAAASTVDAIEEIATLFQEQTQIEVVISGGPSNGLAQQILAGAPADVFLSANKKWGDAVTEQGLAGETVDLLTNRMVLIVPRGNPAGIADVGDLTGSKVTHVAIAGEGVPAGIYAEQALRHLKLFDALSDSNKLARGSDVRITLTYVERGEAEAGIVYATDARISDQVAVIAELDPESYDPVVYPAVLLNSAADRPAARRFFQFLQSADAQAVFQRCGFTSLLAPSAN
jgi:molybdate transport system substrate-binding protein